MHDNKVIPTRKAHDATLYEIWARLHMGNDGVQSHEYTSGQQGVPFLSHIPIGSHSTHDPLPSTYVSLAAHTSSKNTQLHNHRSGTLHAALLHSCDTLATNIFCSLTNCAYRCSQPTRGTHMQLHATPPY